jgi:hypothetical protein
MDSTTRTGQLSGLFIVLVAATVLAGAGVADDAEVEGTFTMNGTTVELTHGYVAEDDGDFVIYLTDRQVEYRKLDKLWTRRDVNYVQLSFGPDGSNFGQDLRHEVKGSVISGGGTQEVEFDAFGPEAFVGRAYLPEPVEFFDQTYQYEVSFKLRLPSLEDLGGSVLPAGGGEPGAAYLVWNAACLEGDPEVLKQLLPPEEAAELDGEYAEEALEFILMMTPSEVTVVGGVLFEDEAELEIEGLMDGARGHGKVTMVQHGELWVETATKWRGGPVETDQPEPEEEVAEDEQGARRYTTEVVGDLTAAVVSYFFYGDQVFPGPTDGWAEISSYAEDLGHHMAHLPTTDAWGHAILYRSEHPDEGFRIASPGPDGEPFDGPGSDDIVASEGGFLSGWRHAGGDETYTRLKQRDTARWIIEARSVLEAYAVEEFGYPRRSEWTDFDFVAPTISEHPVLSKYSAYTLQKIPVNDAWGRAFQYWSDGGSYLLVSAGPDRGMDQDWMTETEPAQPDGDDIVIKDGFLHFAPEGVGMPN